MHGLGLDFVLNKPAKTFLRQLVQFNYQINIRIILRNYYDNFLLWREMFFFKLQTEVKNILKFFQLH